MKGVLQAIGGQFRVTLTHKHHCGTTMSSLGHVGAKTAARNSRSPGEMRCIICLLYTSDAADDM
eukprot:12811278-Alexandrium_andersonii.AAC.1